MKINQNLKNAVEAKDIKGARASLLGLINKDKRLKEFQTPLFAKYAEQNLSGFWDKDNGETKFPAKDKWSSEFWESMCIELEYNFSKEKFEFIISLMQYLRDSSHEDFLYKQKAKPTKTDDDLLRYVILGGIAGGAIGLIGGAIIGKTLVGGIIGSLVGASGGYVSKKVK